MKPAVTTITIPTYGIRVEGPSTNYSEKTNKSKAVQDAAQVKQPTQPLTAAPRSDSEGSLSTVSDGQKSWQTGHSRYSSLETIDLNSSRDLRSLEEQSDSEQQHSYLACCLGLGCPIIPS